MTTTEDDLFAAYRHLAGYSAQCGCGAWIDAPDADGVASAVLNHGRTTEDVVWLSEQAAVAAMKRVASRPCPCHNHGAS